MNVYRLEPEIFVAYILITIFYLVLVVLATLMSKSNSLRFVSLGLLTAVAATGYGGLIPTTMSVAPTMMKIAFLLVLAGALVPFYAAATTRNSHVETYQTDYGKKATGAPAVDVVTTDLQGGHND